MRGFAEQEQQEQQAEAPMLEENLTLAQLDWRSSEADCPKEAALLAAQPAATKPKSPAAHRSWRRLSEGDLRLMRRTAGSHNNNKQTNKQTNK
jgi:hypothetical protein